MSHSKEINETSNRQLQITHVELKLYSDAGSESTQDDVEDQEIGYLNSTFDGRLKGVHQWWQKFLRVSRR
jgi:hypothetical protein